jgi:neutral amino acid transport system permease protein
VLPRTPLRQRVVGRGVPALLLAVLLVPLFLLLGAAPAGATTEQCVSDQETACILGTIRSEEGPVADIVLTVTDASGTETEVTTDEAGKWSVPATEDGDYVVVLNEDSLPDGIVTSGPTERTVTVKLDSTQRVYPALFEVRTGDYDASTSKSDLFIQSAVNGLRLGLLLALASVGLSLIYGTTGLSNFAHAEQVTLGGLLAYGFVNVLGLGLWLGGLITVLLCAATGYLQDRGIWQPLRRRGLGLTQMMIVTIGMSLAAQYAFQYFVGGSTVKVVVESFDTFSWGPVTQTSIQLVAMGVSVVVIAIVGYVLLRTRLGRATRAVSDNPALAAASGIDVDRIIRLVWTASAGLAGLSGLFYALAVSNGIRWDTGMQILLLLFAAVTLGGLGTAFGALVGSLVIGMVVEMAGPLGAPGDLKYAVALAILILLLLVRPQGLLGRAERVG